MPNIVIIFSPHIGIPGPVDMIPESVDLEVDSPFDELDDGGQNSDNKPTLDIRTYFPETWLWDLHFVG